MAKSKNKIQVTENTQLPRWRNRIVGHGEEHPEQLLANPKNTGLRGPQPFSAPGQPRADRDRTPRRKDQAVH
jgi:hypothetical protein